MKNSINKLGSFGIEWAKLNVQKALIQADINALMKDVESKNILMKQTTNQMRKVQEEIDRIAQQSLADGNLEDLVS